VASGFRDANNLLSNLENGFESDRSWGTDFSETYVVIATSAVQGRSGGQVNRNAIENTNCYLRYNVAA